MAGRFIAIEGGDGSGKGTQAALLAERLAGEGRSVLRLSFPRYDQPATRYVSRYLNGDYGGADDVHPDLASLPYALDRLLAADDIRRQLQRPDSVVIADRYVASNLAHQGTKLAAETDRRRFYDEILELEYRLLGLPRPDLNIVLLVEPDQAQANVDQKGRRNYTERRRDIHEADADHLERAKANYQELCRLYPAEFIALDCQADRAMRTVDDIHADIIKLIEEIGT